MADPDEVSPETRAHTLMRLLKEKVHSADQVMTALAKKDDQREELLHRIVGYEQRIKEGEQGVKRSTASATKLEKQLEHEAQNLRRLSLELKAERKAKESALEGIKKARLRIAELEKGPASQHHLNQQLESKTAEVHSLSMQLEAERKAKESALEGAKRARQRVAELEKGPASVHHLKQQLESKMEEVHSLSLQLEAEQKMKESALEGAKRARLRVAELEKNQADEGDLKQELNSSMAEMHALTLQLEAEQKAKESALEGIKEARQRVAELETELDTKPASEDDLKRQLKSSMSEMHALTLQLEAERKAKESALEGIKEARQRVAELETKPASEDDLKRQLKSSMSEMHALALQLEAERKAKESAVERAEKAAQRTAELEQIISQGLEAETKADTVKKVKEAKVKADVLKVHSQDRLEKLPTYSQELEVAQKEKEMVTEVDELVAADLSKIIHHFDNDVEDPDADYKEPVAKRRAEVNDILDTSENEDLHFQESRTELVVTESDHEMFDHNDVEGESSKNMNKSDKELQASSDTTTCEGPDDGAEKYRQETLQPSVSQRDGSVIICDPQEKDNTSPVSLQAPTNIQPQRSQEGGDDIICDSRQTANGEAKKKSVASVAELVRLPPPRSQTFLEEMFSKYEKQQAVKVRALKEKNEASASANTIDALVRIQLGRLWRCNNQTDFENIVAQLSRSNLTGHDERIFHKYMVDAIKNEQRTLETEDEQREKDLSTGRRPIGTSVKQMKLMCLMRTLDVPGKLLEGLVSRFANYLFHTIFVEAQHACFKMKGSEARNIVRTYFMLLRMIGDEEKVRLFLYDAFYFRSPRNHIFLCILLDVWPEILTWYDFRQGCQGPLDPVVETVIWAIFNTSLAKTTRDLKIEDAFHRLRRECNVNRPPLTALDLCTKLVKQVQGDVAKKTLKESTTRALVLLAKTQDFRWTHNNLVNMLLELLKVVWEAQGDQQQSKYLLLYWIISTIGAVSQIYPSEARESVLGLFDSIKTFLLNTNDPQMEEVCLKAIIRTGHHLQYQVIKILSTWRPKFALSADTEQLVLDFLGTRGKTFGTKAIQGKRKRKIFS